MLNGVHNFRTSTEFDSFLVEYKSWHKYRGHALIFWHETFAQTWFLQRPTAAVDKELLLYTLKRKFQFTVSTFKDLDEKKITVTLDHFANLDHSDSDCLLVIVLSYGESGQVHSYNTTMLVDNFWKPFANCESLRGKPKCFIFQTCPVRTIPPPNITRYRSLSTTVSGSTDATTHWSSQLRYPPANMLDVAVVYSLSEQQQQLRANGNPCSMFVASLCRQLELGLKQQSDLLSVLSLVCRDMDSLSRKTDDDNCNYVAFTDKTVPVMCSQLPRLFVFRLKKDYN